VAGLLAALNNFYLTIPPYSSKTVIILKTALENKLMGVLNLHNIYFHNFSEVEVRAHTLYRNSGR